MSPAVPPMRGGRNAMRRLLSPAGKPELYDPIRQAAGSRRGRMRRCATSPLSARPLCRSCSCGSQRPPHDRAAKSATANRSARERSPLPQRSPRCGSKRPSPFVRSARPRSLQVAGTLRSAHDRNGSRIARRCALAGRGSRPSACARQPPDPLEPQGKRQRKQPVARTVVESISPRHSWKNSTFDTPR